MKRYFLLLPFVLGLVTLLVLPHNALADTVVGDGTPESCTETAFATAMQAGGTISFNCGTAPYTLTLSSTYHITTNLEVAGASLISLQKIGAGRHFTVTNSAFTLNNLTLSGGPAQDGGGVDVSTLGVLTTENVTFTQNAAGAALDGGAIHNSGTIILNNSRFIENRARTRGGAIFNGEQAVLINVDFISNFIEEAASFSLGGALANTGEATYIGGNVFGNRAYQSNTESRGGGIANFNGGVLTLQQVTFQLNHASQGSALYTSDGRATGTALRIIQNGVFGHFSSAVEVQTEVSDQSGLLYLTDSEIASNVGIGVWVGPNSDFFLGSSTIADNRHEAMFVLNSREVVLHNDTISGNDGAVSVFGAPLWIYNSTLIGNGDYNLALHSGSTGVLTSSALVFGAVADCHLSVPGPDTVLSLGYNLDSTNSCRLNTTTDMPGHPAVQLGALRNNGGSTRTHLPDPASPLIDHSECNSSILADQRGVPRPQGATCDIGSVERAPGDDATPTPIPTETLGVTATTAATPTGTLTTTPTGTPPTFNHQLYLPLVQR